MRLDLIISMSFRRASETRAAQVLTTIAARVSLALQLFMLINCWASRRSAPTYELNQITSENVDERHLTNDVQSAN